MWLGRPFIDHKTSSDRRERQLINFRPLLLKSSPAKEKKEKEEEKKNISYLQEQMINSEL